MVNSLLKLEVVAQYLLRLQLKCIMHTITGPQDWDSYKLSPANGVCLTERKQLKSCNSTSSSSSKTGSILSLITQKKAIS